MSAYVVTVPAIQLAVGSRMYFLERGRSVPEGASEVDVERLRDGAQFATAVVEGAVARLRPILMTSVATIVAALPEAFPFGFHGGVPSPEAIARARAWWGGPDGRAITSIYDGSSTSALLTGLMWTAAGQEAPQAELLGRIATGELDMMLADAPVPVSAPLPPLAMFMVWHLRHQQDPLHRWLRQTLVEVASTVSAQPSRPQG